MAVGGHFKYFLSLQPTLCWNQVQNRVESPHAPHVLGAPDAKISTMSRAAPRLMQVSCMLSPQSMIASLASVNTTSQFV